MPGAVIYKGRSLIDDGPIAAIAVWGSTNRKTGDMLQVYIIRTDMDPIEAIRPGRAARVLRHDDARPQPGVEILAGWPVCGRHQRT